MMMMMTTTTMTKMMMTMTMTITMMMMMMMMMISCIAFAICVCEQTFVRFFIWLYSFFSSLPHICSSNFNLRGNTVGLFGR